MATISKSVRKRLVIADGPLTAYDVDFSLYLTVALPGSDLSTRRPGFAKMVIPLRELAQVKRAIEKLEATSGKVL